MNVRSGNTGKTELHDKLRKILALTASPSEGEASAAMAALHRLLEEHNLSIADLEKKGATKAQVLEGDVDLGRAAFKWKLNLADVIADHYYCHSLTDHTLKQVRFVGRPDNVESLKMLYSWVVDQIKLISAQERRNHFVRTNEHIDPLRWQVQFGLGIVSRLGNRLVEIRDRQAESAGVSLALSHKSEISDYLESKGMRRVDGKDTAAMAEYRKRWAAEDARLKELKATDLEAYYCERPWERPLTEKEQATKAKKDAAWDAKYNRREAARQRREDRKTRTPEQERREEQEYTARQSGRDNAARVNLQPFIEGQTAKKEVR